MKERIIEIIKQRDEAGTLLVQNAESIASQIEDEVLSVYKHLRNINPYPIDIFPDPSENDTKDLGNFLHEHGRNSERIFGWWGRKVWNNCLDDLRDNLNFKL